MTLEEAQRWDAVGLLDKMDLSAEEQAKVTFWRDSGLLPSSPKSPPLREPTPEPRSENPPVPPYEVPYPSPGSQATAETFKYKVDSPDFSLFDLPDSGPSRSDNYQMPNPLDDLLSGFPAQSGAAGSANYRLPDWMQKLISNPPAAATRYPPPQESEDLPDWLQELLRGESG